jgi:hypothetical protein
MFLIKRSTEVDGLVDNSVDDDESFCGEEFRSLFELVYLKFSPKPLHFFDAIVLAEP